ncbi:hypothetical protein M9H77_30433 [Catharanthus roseus]|uniref:Uncharacterized protein n=1 Tax=Catharanthus roseus TaxID=4058 RepID=A0ACB9ZXK8_CATRO|nr:hypothetical protein M9H77_30433 [Catharanthus roseus]
MDEETTNRGPRFERFRAELDVENPKFEVGMIFTSKHVLKDDIKSHRRQLEFRFVKGVDMDEFMEKVHRYLNYPISRDQAYRRRKYAKEIIERKCKNCGALGHNKRICKSSEQRVEDEGPTQGLQQSVLFDLVQTSQTSRLINFHSSEMMDALFASAQQATIHTSTQISENVVDSSSVTVPKPIDAQVKDGPEKKRRKCTFCKEVGHNKLTCPTGKGKHV